MRSLTDHRIDDGSFDEAIHGLVRGAPWWMTSAVLHGLLLLILAQIQVPVARAEPIAAISSEKTETLEEPDVPDEPEPQPPDNVIIEKPTETEIEDVQPQDPTDMDYDEPANQEGEDDGPLTSADWNTSIGLLGGAKGGRGGRGGTNKGDVQGGTARTDGAVELGLQWLADHQDVNDDGRWDCDDYAKHDPVHDKCDGPGGALYDVGVTGLSLLAFLGAGYTDKGAGKFTKNVRMGLRYLMQSQDDEGCFGARSSGHFMYNHAIASLAMCEAYWMTRNPRYKKPAQESLNFIARSRNPYLAWRYEPRGGENDTSVTGWMVMALKSGKFGGLDIDPDAFEGARQWIDKMTDPEFGQVGYNAPGGGSARPEGMQDRFPVEKTQAMTAVGVLTRIFLGEDPRTSEMIKRGVDLCIERPPTWNPDDGSIDMYYWYYGTLAMFQAGGTPWKRWNKHMKTAIVEHQHPKGSGRRTGSWDPIGAWGHDGGRVYATACMVMCLEVYYRYDRVFIGR